MIPTFKIQAEYNDLMYVVLQVDTDTLTPELATKINNFWAYSKERMESEDGDVIRAVARLYGARAICKMLRAGGACFNARNPLAVRQWQKELQYLLADMQHELYLSEGIRVIEAQVEIPDFDGVELLDMTASGA